MQDHERILSRAEALIHAYREGRLGGEVMPEDAHPDVPPGSRESLLYFTLPMALNYQRNSYKLWESALACWQDSSARWVFDPAQVCDAGEEALRSALVRHKVALQPNRQPVIWHRLCRTLETHWQGDVRGLLAAQEYSAAGIRNHLQTNKALWPYLSGNKICNYWLYVLEGYGSIRFTDREAISVAPDTHVIQSSIQLGVLTESEAQRHDAQAVTAERWREILQGTPWAPIDLHTPMWLWSRGKFSLEIE